MDAIERAKQELESFNWAKKNWEMDPGPWAFHLEEMEICINELLDYLEDNYNHERRM
jgi:hypothetical protein